MGVLRDRVAAGKKAATTNRKKRDDYYASIRRSGNDDASVDSFPSTDYKVVVEGFCRITWHSRQPARNTKRDIKRFEKRNAKIIETSYDGNRVILSQREVW